MAMGVTSAVGGAAEPLPERLRGARTQTLIDRFGLGEQKPGDPDQRLGPPKRPRHPDDVSGFSRHCPRDAKGRGLRLRRRVAGLDALGRPWAIRSASSNTAKSIMRSPVVFAVKKPVAQQLGWVGPRGARARDSRRRRSRPPALRHDLGDAEQFRRLRLPGLFARLRQQPRCLDRGAFARRLGCKRKSSAFWAA